MAPRNPNSTDLYLRGVGPKALLAGVIIQAVLDYHNLKGTPDDHISRESYAFLTSERGRGCIEDLGMNADDFLKNLQHKRLRNNSWLTIENHTPTTQTHL